MVEKETQETSVEEETEPVEETPTPASVNLDEEEAEPMYEPESDQEEPPARRVSPEAAQALGNMYEEPEYEQPEYGARPSRRRPPPESGYGEANFMRNLMSGDVGIGEALMIMEYWDRKDRKDDKPQGLTREDIPTIVAAALEKAGLSGKPRDEMPAWAEKQQKTLEALTERFEEDEQEKRDKKLVDAATKPFQEALEKEQEKRELIEKKIEELGTPPEQGPPKSELDSYIDYKEKMIKAGFIKEDKGAITFGPEGIPVDGTIPAWTVYAPTMIDEVFDNLEKRLENIAFLFGAGKKTRDLKTLIDMPTKPKPKPERPPLRPAEPEPTPPPQPPEEPPETPPLESLPPVEEPAEVEQEPPGELIALPTRKPEIILENRVPEPEHPEPEPEPPEEPRPEPEPEGIEEEPPETHEQEETPPPEEYMCPDCGKPFSSLKSLRGHCGATGHHYPDELRTSKKEEEDV